MAPAPASATPPRAAGVDTAALPEGHTVFEYRIKKGGGGFGITYLARDINLELPVALKEYFPGDLTSRAADLSVRVRVPEAEQQFHWGLERFLDEARALASFRHPSIIRVLRYFRENGTAYIVMEYESGDPLKRWLACRPMLDQAGLLRVTHPLMDGLEAVHRLDFLHRDIKPDNIYIRADGTPVLLDFGAARRTTGGRDLTNIVSPGFAPFEQYHSKGNQGPWSDIYSLGAVMYWMTTGQKPVESASRVQDDAMPRAVDIGNTAVFGEALLHAIDWALSPHEGRRPQNVVQLRAALEEAAPKPAGLAPAAGHTPAVTSAGPERQTPALAAGALRRNVLGTVMFLNLVASPKHPVDQHMALRERFNELIGKALKGVAESSRIVMDTGDGVAVCFLGDPEEALQSALLLCAGCCCRNMARCRRYASGCIWGRCAWCMTPTSVSAWSVTASTWPSASWTLPSPTRSWFRGPTTTSFRASWTTPPACSVPWARTWTNTCIHTRSMPCWTGHPGRHLPRRRAAGLKTPLRSRRWPR